MESSWICKSLASIGPLNGGLPLANIGCKMKVSKKIKMAKFVNFFVGIKLIDQGFQDLITIISEGEIGVLKNQEQFLGFSFMRRHK